MKFLPSLPHPYFYRIFYIVVQSTRQTLPWKFLMGQDTVLSSKSASRSTQKRKKRWIFQAVPARKAEMDRKIMEIVNRYKNDNSNLTLAEKAAALKVHIPRCICGVSSILQHRANSGRLQSDPNERRCLQVVDVLQDRWAGPLEMDTGQQFLLLYERIHHCRIW